MKQPKQKKGKCPSEREFFEEHYIKLRKSTTQIAKEVGCAVNTVWIRLKKLKMCRTISEANNGEYNGMWKGTDVGKKELHEWVRKNKPKPKLCVDCKKAKPYDLANISQEYKRDINDFKWLCRSCHIKKDGRLNKLIRKGGLRYGN